MVETQERERLYTTDPDAGPSTMLVVLFSLLIIAVLGFMVYFFSNRDMRSNPATVIERNQTAVPVPVPAPTMPSPQINITPAPNSTASPGDGTNSNGNFGTAPGTSGNGTLSQPGATGSPSSPGNGQSTTP